MSSVKYKRLGCGVFKLPESKKGYSIQIGTLDANITDEMIEDDKNLQKALKSIGIQLMKQLNCDGINFTSISFQQMWKPKEELPIRKSH